MSLRAEADAALARNPNAEVFVASTMCKKCQTYVRYTDNTKCQRCQKIKNDSRPKAALSSAGTPANVERAIELYQSTTFGLTGAADAAKCSLSTLRQELERRGIPIVKKSAGGYQTNQVMAVEFEEARVPLMAGKLLDNWYRSIHA